jgi:peptide/nickel transport system substrate-binding protein
MTMQTLVAAIQKYRLPREIGDPFVRHPSLRPASIPAFAGKTTIFVSAILVAALTIAPAQAQKAKDNVRIAQVQAIAGLDAYLDARPETYFVWNAVFDTLIVYDDKSGGFAPLLAKSWQRVDPQTLDFELRDDLTWHDGAKFDADDVVYTISYLIDPQVPLRFKGFFTWIQKVEKLGPYKVRIVAQKPTPYDLAMLASPDVMMIYPKHLHEGLKDKIEFGRHPVGTGPYQVSSLDATKGMFLTRRDDYRQGSRLKPAPAIKTMTLVPIPDPGTRVAELMVGNLDIARDIPVDQSFSLGETPGLKVTLLDTPGIYYLLMDAKGRSGKTQLTDARVRQAILMTIDDADFVKMVAGDNSGLKRPEAVCKRAQLGCDYSAKPPAYDIAGARKLLAEAGYPDGFDVQITAPSSGTAKLAEILAGKLRQIGIRASVDAQTFAAYRDKQRDGKLQLLVNGWSGGGLADVQATLDLFFSASAAEYHGMPQFLDLARRSTGEMDDGQGRATVRELLDGVTAMGYIVPIAPQPVVWVHSKEVALRNEIPIADWGLNFDEISWR